MGTNYGNRAYFESFNMSDPLSIMGSVAGLISLSASLLSTMKRLSDSYRDAPTSVQGVIAEVQDMNLIFCQVQLFIAGTGKQPNHQRLTMISVHSLIATLTGCSLVYSRLYEYVCNLVGQNMANTHPNAFEFKLDRVKWVLWKEAEVMVVVEDLQRHKLSLNLMLTIIQW